MFFQNVELKVGVGRREVCQCRSAEIVGGDE